MSGQTETQELLPGAGLKLTSMPGHWLLARMGKRVLRPGGLELTRTLLNALAIQTTDAVVEFAPGLGVTAQLTLSRQPASYVGVERDAAAAATVQRFLRGPEQRCIVGRAEDTGLADSSATVIYGEAMLTMHSTRRKTEIIREALRVLRPGGRYGLHELCLVPDTLDGTVKDAIQRDLSAAIHVSARPLTVAEWRALLEAEGFAVQAEFTAPMHLLEPRRMLQDEGLGRTVRIAFNMLRNGTGRQRVLAMRRVFRTYRANLAALALVAIKT